MKKGTIKIIISFMLSFLITFIYLFTPQVFYSLDNRLRDFMFVLRGELPKTNKIVIVDIDDKSLKLYGQWPWSRNIVSKLLNNLTQLHPGIIGLDIVFAEADRSSPHLLKKKFPSIKATLPNYDMMLADTFRTSPIVGGYIFKFNTIEETHEAPMIPAVIVQKGLRNNHTFLTPKSVLLNIPILQNALYSSGFFNNIPDSNGMTRTVPLLLKYDHTLFTSLALEMVRIYSQKNRIDVLGDEFGIHTLSFGDYVIPVDHTGRLFINFRGSRQHYTYISASDILMNKVPKEKIENKFILVGTSSLGIYDFRAIPLDNNIPGVEIHANIIDNLLTQDYLHEPYNHIVYNILILWALIFILMYIFNQIRSWLIVPFAFVLFYLLSSLFYTLLFHYGLVLNLLTPLLAFVLTLIASITIDYFTSFKQKEEAKKILGKKVSTSVMQHLIQNSEEGLIRPKEVETSIFFSDIQGFTSISEKIGSPVKLIDLLNTYMTPMVESIITHQGTIDKFIGDAIMAYWNAPVKVPRHADKALQTAIEQIESLDAINQVIHKKYQVLINIGIGIHTGIVTAGDMGAEGRSDYTIIGDNVNFASRLEGLTRHYDVQLLISESTYNALTDTYTIRPIDTVAVKGKKNAVKIYEVICKTQELNPEEEKLYLKAYTHYQQAEIQDAHAIFLDLSTRFPSVLYTQYLHRCQYTLENPDKTFSPILHMQTK